MKTSNVIEKTTNLKMNNAEVKVASLPEEIRYEVETLDRFNQKKLDILSELEIIELAIHSQKLKLGEMITKLSKPLQESDTDKE